MLNNITLAGRLTAEPELRYTQNGTAVASFILAVGRDYKNAAGERETDFISIQCWRGTAENCAKHMHKGDFCAVDGRLQINSYQAKDGSKRKAAIVVAEMVYFISAIKQPQQNKQPEAEPQEKRFDDDLPF
ncbi:MAG: single-stranded DNA-binding protein [Firmicutes bacterium]|nr:single-stranded DNA-binding protein [Bacillota bacterium]